MLIGTRNGDILEINMEAAFKETKASEARTSQVSSQRSVSVDSRLRKKISTIHFEARILLRNHAVQIPINQSNASEYFLHKKVHMAAHPKMNILVTIGNDKMLCLWHTSNMELIHRMNLGVVPTFVKWNQDGTLLVVGFHNGNVKIFESKASKTVFGRHGNSNYSLDFF